MGYPLQKINYLYDRRAVGREVKRIRPAAIGLNRAHYIRAFVPGGTFFFTVTLLERRRKLLNRHIANLRASFMAARQRRPFTVEAIVIWLDPVRRLEIE